MLAAIPVLSAQSPDGTPLPILHALVVGPKERTTIDLSMNRGDKNGGIVFQTCIRGGDWIGNGNGDRISRTCTI